MLTLSLLILLRKAPRIIMIVLLFIVTTLLGFLLMGCTKDSSAYSEVYLVEFKFNTSSSMFPLIEKAYAEEGDSELSQMKVRANYLGVCVNLDNSTTCGSSDDSTVFEEFLGVSFFNANSSTDLDLVSIASQYSNHVVKPYELIATLVLTLILMLNIFYCTMSFLPLIEFAKNSAIVLSLVTSLVWGTGCMWSYIGGNSAKYLIEPSSMLIITGSVGSRAQSMTWVSFAFILVVTIGCILLKWRDHRLLKLQDEEKLSSGRSSL